MSLLEHSQYDNNQASVLVSQGLRAHFLHIDLGLLVKLPLTSLIPICDKRTHRVTLSACTPFVSLRYG